MLKNVGLLGQIYVDKGSNTIVFVDEIKNFRIKWLFFQKL